MFSPAYREEEFEELLSYVDDVVFNSVHQVKKFGQQAKKAGKSIGLRVNPECSTQEGHEIYDPCAPFSRLGTTLAQFQEEILPMLDGLHFHTLCEQDSEDLEITVKAFEEKFGAF
ncbi:carboxynorspermidine decarboxylase [gut metagenome]|uniref:Carboxynorspermidine decarboxylase n=1 Tax=gut metagenome TaxID=749906 RepID=J9CCY8_9ZZZZ